VRARPSVKTLRNYVVRRLRLGRYLRDPGDGRVRPEIPASTLLWAFLLGQVLRFCSFGAVERLVRSPARRAASLQRGFGDDALAYFTERLDPTITRQTMAASIRGAKRNKAFDDSRFIGLAVDGTGVSRCRLPSQHCDLCRPVKNADRQIISYVHAFSMIEVVGVGLCLPFDIEPYGPGDSEDAASQRLLRRAIGHLGVRFADYVVADGKYATAPFCHLADEFGLRVVIRLKDNVPTLLSQAERRFLFAPPSVTFDDGSDRVEIWDADDLCPWDGLRWPKVRVIRYRQHKSDGSVVEAFWLTNFPILQAGPRRLYAMAKSRWQIENQGFNDAKNRYGMEHTRHHHKNSMLVVWLLIAFAITIERLFRLRFLHRGLHPVRSAIDLHFDLILSLGRPLCRDTS
jgi:hypothetical protein